ncbi:MAG: carboxymuconolactone decarboxylase family protein [Acidobacteriota bacterium]|nr:carboxymuconolactone decarboxylase family protein [Acidobacteriota bacterium]
MKYRHPVLMLLFAVALVTLTGCAGETEPVAAAVVAQPPAGSLYAGSPYLGELRNSVVYGEIWERPQLSKRDRSLITVAVLQALVRDELRLHIPRGLDNGLTPAEISEIILHVTFYAGWPTGVQASVMAAAVFAERGLEIGPLERAPEMADQPETPASASGAYAAVPRLGELRNSVLYGDVWERPVLSKRDRSLITVAVLQAMYATNQLRTHIGRALDENGVTPQELSEAILHVTFYAGWPAAVNAGGLAAEAYEDRGVALDTLQ